MSKRREDAEWKLFEAMKRSGMVYPTDVCMAMAEYIRAIVDEELTAISKRGPRI